MWTRIPVLPTALMVVGIASTFAQQQSDGQDDPR
jgi:hypothetical protein